jgi:hypothetical protein
MLWLDTNSNLYVATCRYESASIDLSKYDIDGNRLWSNEEAQLQADGVHPWFFSVDSAEAIHFGVNYWRLPNDMGNAFFDYVQNTTPGLPIILKWPLTQRVHDNQSLALEAEARGPEPITFQWRLNGINIIGATNSPLVFQNVSTNQTGVYSILVTNQFGCALSEDFGLDVIHVNPFQLRPPERGTNVITGSDGTFMTNRYLRIMIEGIEDERLYYIEKSANLVDWQEIYGTGFGPEGATEFQDSIRSPESQMLFYRAKTDP